MLCLTIYMFTSGLKHGGKRGRRQQMAGGVVNPGQHLCPLWLHNRSTFQDRLWSEVKQVKGEFFGGFPSMVWWLYTDEDEKCCAPLSWGLDQEKRLVCGGCEVMQQAIYTYPKKKKKQCADGLVWRVGFPDVTHRSSSSLGSFLLMTASSLFVNIWKAGQERSLVAGEPSLDFKQGQETPAPNLDAITSLKDGRCIKERINDSNLISCDRVSVTPWETVRVSGDKGSARGHVFCLLSKNQLGTLDRRWTSMFICQVVVMFTPLQSSKHTVMSTRIKSAPPACDSAHAIEKSTSIELMMMFKVWRHMKICGNRNLGFKQECKTSPSSEWDLVG